MASGLAEGVQDFVAMVTLLNDRVEAYMSLLSLRQKLTASNIANVDTPGYKTRDAAFSEALSEAESRPHLRVVEAGGLVTKSDGNNVSLEREAQNLAESALRFSVAAQYLQAHIRLTRSAIEESR